MASADVLLHPVRLRIVTALLGDRALTTGQLAIELSDIPTGSLYRHIALLVKEGVLQVVAERRVRGALERTYALHLGAARLPAGEAAAWLNEDEFAEFIRDLFAVIRPRLALPARADRRRRILYGVALPAPGPQSV